MNRLLLLVFLLALPSQAEAQCSAFPCIGDQRFNLILHDVGHAVTSTAVVYGLDVLPGVELSETHRYMLGTLALPVAQEVYDRLRYGNSSELQDSLHDIVTYQGAWSVYLLKRKKYWQAALITMAWGGFIYWWNVERGR